MAHPILMPKPGQMTEECVLVAWHKNEGDPIKKGDLLFEIETDKSNMDVEAFDDGVLLRRVVADGETVPVNTVCGYVGEAGEAVPEVADARAAPALRPVVTGATADDAAGSRSARPTASKPGPGSSTTVPGNSDALHPHARDGRLRISPRARRMAVGLSIDPHNISGTGPGGRIVERDVRATSVLPSTPTAAASLPGQAVAAATGTLPGVVANDADVEVPRPMSRMRRVIADRLTLSATTVPQFTITVAVDMTRALALRAQLRSDGVSITVTDFVVSAVAQTLVEFPDVNARTDGALVWPRSRVNIGVAVSLPDGLVVPVIRDADRMSLADIHSRTAELAAAARAGRLLPDDMSGGTFTISNLGMHGVEQFSAIVNPGESAILAVSSIVATLVAIGEGVAVRQVMRVTLTSDHRLVDGELAARFLNALRRRLEDPVGFRVDLLNG